MKKVTDAIANDDFTLDVTFDDGSVRRFDMKPYLDFPVFQKLKDIAYFRDLNIDFDTVQWPDGQDISPETIYMEGVRIGDQVVV